MFFTVTEKREIRAWLNNGCVVKSSRLFVIRCQTLLAFVSSSFFYFLVIGFCRARRRSPDARILTFLSHWRQDKHFCFCLILLAPSTRPAARGTSSFPIRLAIFLILHRRSLLLLSWRHVSFRHLLLFLTSRNLRSCELERSDCLRKSQFLSLASNLI